MGRYNSGGFSARDRLTQNLMSALDTHILSNERYSKIDTGIEFRFGDDAASVHQQLYDSLGPTTDLLRYFPDALYFDHAVKLPTWDVSEKPLENSDDKGLFTFFVEYKYSNSKCPYDVNGVPSEFVGQIEREAWLTYKRLSNPNPDTGTYLDGLRSRIALFYAVSYAPDKLYADWEENITPIRVIDRLAIPNRRSVNTRGSGTPWINFDIRKMKPLQQFLTEDMYWSTKEASLATTNCKTNLFN